MRRVAKLGTMAGLLLMASGAWAEFRPTHLDRVHSQLGFTASTLLFDVEGHFNKYEVLLEGDPNMPEQAKLSVTIDATSIDTDNTKRDEHLSSPDFFDVQKYPAITFVSERIEAKPDSLRVTGTLDMHGHKKKLTIPFRVARGKNGAGVDSTAYKAKLTLDRNEFGVGANSVAAKLSLEDAVTLDLLLVVLP